MKLADLKIHPAAELFPLMTDEELDELAQSIQEHGLREPVVFWNVGELLDGRNRVLACERVGIEPPFIYFDGNDPWVYVADLNIHRRHLTVGQKAAIAAEMAEGMAEEARDNQLAALRQGTESPSASIDARGKSAARAAATVGVSTKSVERAQQLKREDPEAFEEVRRGKRSLNSAVRSLIKPIEVPEASDEARTAARSCGVFSVFSLTKATPQEAVAAMTVMQHSDAAAHIDNALAWLNELRPLLKERAA